MSLSPDELVEKIKNCIITTREEPWGYMAEQVLRIVLQAIKDGEVVSHEGYYHDHCSGCECEVGEIVLKPEYAKMISGE